MQYCTRCTYPAISVNISFDKNGVCSGCKVAEERKEINWDERFEIFKGLSLSLLLGGCIGNGMDRWRLGYVNDFIEHRCDCKHKHVINPVSRGEEFKRRKVG